MPSTWGESFGSAWGNAWEVAETSNAPDGSSIPWGSSWGGSWGTSWGAVVQGGRRRFLHIPKGFDGRTFQGKAKSKSVTDTFSIANTHVESLALAIASNADDGRCFGVGAIEGVTSAIAHSVHEVRQAVSVSRNLVGTVEMESVSIGNAHSVKETRQSVSHNLISAVDTPQIIQFNYRAIARLLLEGLEDE